MGDDLPAFLSGLPGHIFGLMLLFCRVSAAVMLVPGWGESAPRMVRAGLAVALTLVLYPPLAASLPAPGGMAQNIGMIAAELAAGGLLGWLARIVAMALPLAGDFISVQMGISNVLQQDIELAQQSMVVGQMFSQALPVMLLSTGFYRLPLEALAGSYDVLPAGKFFAAGDAATVVLRAVSQYWALGVRLAAPFIFAALVWHITLGLVARMVPRVQTFQVSAPGQILGGLLMLIVLTGTIIGVWGQDVYGVWSTLPGH